MFIFADDAEIVIEEHPSAAPPVAAAASGAAPAAPPPAAGADPARGGIRGSSLRVSGERVDRIMDTIGELVIAQARLDQIGRRHNDLDLEGLIEEVERLVVTLRDATLSIRTLPIETVFGRFRP